MPRADATDQMTKVEEWVLDKMKANQARVVDLNSKVASLVEKLPKVKVPFANQLPDQRAVVTRYFDFVAKSTEANRDFAEAIVGAWSPDGATPAPAKPA